MTGTAKGAAPQVASVDRMADALLRDIPNDILERYRLLVRVLVDSARRQDLPPLTVADLQASADRASGLRDASVMSDAWS